MNCKNCETELQADYKYCTQCGAKVVSGRITLQHMAHSLLTSFGWDNQFFVTLRELFLKPQVVFEKYLNGTRKKYTNPFTFFAIGTTLSVFVLSFYSDQLIEISTKASLTTTESIIGNYSPEVDKTEKSAEIADHMQKQQAFNKKIVTFMFKHYNYLSFLFLPFYALLSLMVYGKQNTYGEHLVINAFIHGLLFFFGLILFVLTLLIKHDVYSGGSVLLTVGLYLYAYKKYYKHSFGKTIKKLFRFIAIILVFFILLSLSGFLVGRFVLE